MIGASFRSEPLIAASRRIAPLVERDLVSLAGLGLPEAPHLELEEGAKALENFLKDPMLVKNDTPLQMREVAETMSAIRQYLVELRRLAQINLSLDRPALERVCSVTPEIADGYARDLLDELQERLRSLSELVPRLDDVGIDRKFVTRGKQLALQLQTAIGKEDLDEKNVPFKPRRLYKRKGSQFLLLKHVVRAGRVAFQKDGKHERLYHLRELE